MTWTRAREFLAKVSGTMRDVQNLQTQQGQAGRRSLRGITACGDRQSQFPCLGVSYASQSCDTLDRAWRKQSKLEARLGENWAWPKGMRHRTHEALLDALDDCEERRNAAFIEAAARLFGATGLKDLVL